jgi:hypothetical protein
MAHHLNLLDGQLDLVDLVERTKPAPALPACRFRFDDGPTWSGFSHGSTWNGIDNVAVTRETLDQIVAWFRKNYPGPDDTAEDFAELAPMGNGLYSLGWSFATTIVDEATPPALAYFTSCTSRPRTRRSIVNIG